MDNNTLKNIFEFLERAEGMEVPKLFNLIEKLENHPEGTRYKHKGNLVLKNSKITKLPNDLYVEGWLDLTNCKQLTELPDNLYVGNDLFLNQTNITNIPNKLYVEAYLWIGGTPLANKYKIEDIRKMITSTGSVVKGPIFR
jgi:hypothetical protein